jgi:hypothetical protein
MLNRIIFLFIICLLVLSGRGQSSKIPSTTDSLGRIVNHPAPLGGSLKPALPADETKYPFILTSKESVLSFSILIALFILILIEVWMVYKMHISEDNAIKLIVITVVLMGTLFIIMSGYDERVIAPVFGLFGTIVGYLFGKSNNQPTK